MLRLHDNATSGNAYKVRLFLTQLRLGFERIEYDTDRGATRTAVFLSTKNANGRIPVLESRLERSLRKAGDYPTN
jgi:glutathione S-transferase